MAFTKIDKWGYQVNTSSDACISSINSYYHQVLSYGRDRKVILDAPKHDPNCVLANILAAHYLISTDSSRATQLIQSANSSLEYATTYEKEVFDVVNYLMSSDRDDDVAIELHSKLLNNFPRDLVSLKRAQILCFYMGRPDLSLNLVEQILQINAQEKYIHGMLAFPLLELGQVKDAEKAAKKGFEINKEDPWLHHALCHVYQYECKFKEAVEFMEACSIYWNNVSSFMYTHNWWHVALCYLEGNSSISKVRDVYDKFIWKELEKKDAVSAEVYLNALGLLLRISIRDELEFFEDRLKILARSLTDQAYWHLELHLDVLILWALVTSDEFSKAEELFEGLKLRNSRMTKKKQDLMCKGLLLVEGVYEYGKGNYERALELLGPEFEANHCKIIGASDEQLDVFNEIYIILLLKNGEAVKAIQIIEKQLQKREGAPFLWRLLEKGHSMLGNPEVTNVGARARVLEVAYFT